MTTASPESLRALELAPRMAPSDALFWYAESALPTLRPIIGGLFVLDRVPDPERADRGWDVALALLPRLRQRVVEAPLHLGPPEWVEDAHFDRAYHVRRISLPAPGTHRQLLDLISAVLATPLDHERPLWEAYAIEGLEGGRAALFLKLHHALVDGVGALAILKALTRSHRDAPHPTVAPRRPARRRADRGILARTLDLAWDNARASSGLAWRAATAPLRIARRPVESAEWAWRTARGVRGVLAELGTPKIEDPLARGGSGLSRRLDTLELPLERLRKIKAPLGATLNDLVLTALAGTLGAYYRERRVRVSELSCMVPMNLRGRDERDTLGNRVGTFQIMLPLRESRPERRLARIARQTGDAKRDRRGAAAPFLAQPLGLLPGLAFRWLAREALSRVNVCCTNVPGPAERRYLAGATVDGLFPFVSVVEGMPLAVALLSYAGRLEIGIDTDPEAIPDAHRIAELFEQSLDELEALAQASGRQRREP